MDNVTESELNRAKTLIYSLDLTPVIDRLVLFSKWSAAQAREAAEQYKHYLFIIKKYTTDHSYKIENLPPSKDIDEVWHNHILFTEAYTQFCHSVFNSYLHHHPHHGPDNSLPQNQLEAMFDTTQTLYFKETGDYIYAVRPLSWRDRFGSWLKNISKLKNSEGSKK